MLNQGFIFTDSDLNKLKVKIPVRNGIYARTAFNGLLPRNFQFKQGDTFLNGVFSVEILALKDAGLIKTMRFNFYHNNRNKLFFYGTHKTKSFEEISLENSFKENKLLTIKNYLSE